MAFARHGGFQMWSLLDERSAGFFALGLARAVRAPVCLVCTSGTAAANYYPAVMEAGAAGVPLIILTADRPPELREVGSNQTVDQVKLYGSHVKWYREMPVPEATDSQFRHARTIAARVAATAATAPAGPVHLNWPFREPLIPPLEELGPTSTVVGDAFVKVHAPLRSPRSDTIQTMAARCQSAKRPLIVCGPQEDEALVTALIELADAWQAPILADPLSQLRCGPHVRHTVVDRYDLLLRFPSFAEASRPDLILRFGRTPTSRALNQFLADVGGAQVVVDADDAWSDPAFLASAVIQGDACLFTRRLAEALSTARGADVMPEPAPTPGIMSPWVQHWTRANDVAQRGIDTVLTEPDWFEGRVFLELAQGLPAGAQLYVGNSMPVRDLDAFFPKRQAPLRILANRGASGIDGVVSSALGASAGAPGPTVLVIGDVSFYHDLNGLLAGSRHGLQLVIVLLHNDGGSIFSFLPQAAYPETFDHFQTAHGTDFAGAVESLGGRFTRPADWTEFRTQLTHALNAPGIHVIELRTDGATNVPWHQRVQDRVRAAVAAAGL